MKSTAFSGFSALKKRAFNLGFNSSANLRHFRSFANSCNCLGGRLLHGFLHSSLFCFGEICFFDLQIGGIGLLDILLGRGTRTHHGCTRREHVCLELETLSRAVEEKKTHTIFWAKKKKRIALKAWTLPHNRHTITLCLGTSLWSSVRKSAGPAKVWFTQILQRRTTSKIHNYRHISRIKVYCCTKNSTMPDMYGKFRVVPMLMSQLSSDSWVVIFGRLKSRRARQSTIFSSVAGSLFFRDPAWGWTKNMESAGSIVVFRLTTIFAASIVRSKVSKASTWNLWKTDLWCIRCYGAMGVGHGAWLCLSQQRFHCSKAPIIVHLFAQQLLNIPVNEVHSHHWLPFMEQ